MIKLTLPIPCSVNELTHNNSRKGKGGRSKTQKAKNWIRAANFAVQPFFHEYATLTHKNINIRSQAYHFGKQAYNLVQLQEDLPNLRYEVEYTFFFEKKWPRDIFNYEKQLSDYLCDMGFMIDDSFITKGTVILGGIDKNDPRVEIIINCVDS